MSDYLARLREVATEGAEQTERTKHYTHSTGVMSPVLLALLDVADAAAEIASDDYLEQPGLYATGIRREEAIALTEAVARLRETGEQQ